MKILFIPWHEFLEALRKQNPATVEAWLGRWHFTNEGVILADAKREMAMSLRNAASSARV